MTSFFDSPSRRRRVTYDFVRSSVRMRETTTTCSAALACRKTLYGRNRREVQDKLRETLHRTEHGMPPVPERETVGVYLIRWLDFKKGRLRPRTYTSYEHVVHAHLVPGLGRVRLAKLTPQDVAAWLSRYQANGASGRTARYARARCCGRP